MNRSTEIIGAIKNQGILPLYFHKDKTVSANILQSFYNAGVRVVEYTNRGEEALENFMQLVSLRNDKLPGLLLSAGTIKTKQHAVDYIKAGADFIISPGLSEDVGKYAKEKNVFWIPGCMTPSEIMKAEELGASLIKIFPGNLLGPDFVKSVKELFPGLLFIPTGGVTVDTAGLSAWFKSGVIAVGAGSTLIDKSAIASSEFNKIQSAVAEALKLVQEVKASFNIS